MEGTTVLELNKILKGEIIGETSQKISGIEDIHRAQEHQITFVRSQKYAKFWETSKAAVAVISAAILLEPLPNRALIRVQDADLAMIQLLEKFAPAPPTLEEGIHPTATVHKSVQLGKNCKIGAGCYVGQNVVIGDGTILYPNVTVLDETQIGSHTVIWSGTVIRERSIIGKHCILHVNVSIGADGFGYRPSENGQGLVKIPHIGNVVIGDGVEIGANSCVDRAKFSSTILGNGCKIDNLVQIGHNSILGQSCIMAGNSGLAGSVTLGDGVIIGGSASIKDHVTIHTGATVGAGSGVLADVPAGKTVLGYPACEAKEKLKQWVAVRKLGRAANV